MDQESLQRKLNHIADQANKGQYINALATAQEVCSMLLRALNDVLKGRA